MGTTLSSTYWETRRPESVPPRNVKPTYDPNFGFNGPRKERVMKISEQEMRALKIHPRYRDYCAHLIKDMIICSRKYKPLFGMCRPEMRAYEHCQLEDYIIRMKEYEREKRLRIRELKKQGKTIS